MSSYNHIISAYFILIIKSYDRPTTSSYDQMVSPHPHKIIWYQNQKYLASLLCLISSLALTPPFFAKKKLIFFLQFLVKARMQDPRFPEDLGCRIVGRSRISRRRQGQVQRATGGCLAYPNHSYSGLNTAPAHSPIKSQELEMFLAALAALYLTLVSQWVSQSVPLLNLTQRVTLDTWDPSDI